MRLFVAEVPRWRAVASFSTPVSAPIGIRGERWRILVTAADARHCRFLGLFCRSSSVTVRRGSAAGPTLDRFDLDDGSGAVHTFATGPGTYVVLVQGASSRTRWTVSAQDDY